RGTGEFRPLDLRGPRVADLKTVDAVRVRAERSRERGDPLRLLRGPFLSRVPTDARARATALLDRDVIGVRPLPDIAAPLVPLALLSDPQGKRKRSWEAQVEKEGGSDSWAVDDRGRRPRPAEGSDGLHEMEVRLGGERHNACLLQLGVRSVEELARQVVDGVRLEQLEALGGELVLARHGER